MGYELQAVIAHCDLLHAVTRDRPEALVAALEQGLALLPITDEFFDSVTDGSRAGGLGFRCLPGGFEHRLAEWSLVGPIAYVEADYFGGVGSQRAAVWSGGELVFGPLNVAVGEAFSAEGSPVSQALRCLGVVADDGADEFDAVGLGRHRHGDDWVVVI